MEDVARSAIVIAIGLALLVIQSVFSPLLAPDFFSPSLVLPLVIGLAISPGATPVHGAATSFVLGYMLDLFTGNPLGAQTFVMVFVFLVAFGVGARFSFRGLVFQVAITFLLALVAGALTYALRGMFGPSELATDWTRWTLSLLGSAGLTAAFAPLIFALMRRLEFSRGRRGDEIPL